MHKFGRALVWLSRIRYCRGFGVQSPWAYRLIRYVINEHYPYYAYDDLMKDWPRLSVMERKLGMLYFRLINYRQPNRIFDYASPNDAYAAFMKRGCARSEVIPLATASGEVSFPATSMNRLIEVMRMSLFGDYRSVFECALSHTDDNSMIIVEDIHHGKEEKTFWNHISHDQRTGVTFDLYYCGIIFFDKQRYKENYIVNF